MNTIQILTLLTAVPILLFSIAQAVVARFATNHANGDRA